MLQWLAGVLRGRYVMAIVGGGLAGAILLMFFLLVRGQRDTVVLEVQPVSDPLLVRVYVGGEVVNPGLYTLSRGSRVAEALALAGGTLASAETSGLGMAAVLQDADQILIPARRPTPQAVTTARPSSDSPQATSATLLSEIPADPLPAATPGPVNVNTATAAELEALPDIGPTIAGRIVEYRTQHGPFQSLEELEVIEGISGRMVEDLRPLITLGS